MTGPNNHEKSVMNADLFHRLHSGSQLLVLTNVWDAISACVIVRQGAKAVATSSAAVAWSHGYRDGGGLPVRLVLDSVAAIARVVSVPITVDIEAGYSDDPRSVGETAAALIDVGAVGVNLEDGSGPPDLLCRKVEEVRQRALQRGVPMFINARTDVFLRPLTPEDERLAEAIARARLYANAGADGIFVPGVTDADAIARLAREISLPLNVMARPGLPSGPELQRLGVRRLSAATWFARVSLQALSESATKFLATADSDALSASSGPMVDYNALVAISTDEAH
jgi:2-methylisocitrate lyase-like PEP mutase family enzyme